MIQTAILGGGPAGASCACCLIEKDIYPVIFDHSHPREKPCGGFVSPAAQEQFPLLKRLPVEHSLINKICFISPSGKRIHHSYKKREIWGFSRLTLDQQLVNQAINKGAKLIDEKVITLERKNKLWKVKTPKQSYFIQTVIGADGVNSLTRQNIVGPLLVRDKGLCFGYLVTGLEQEEITIKFLPKREGYIWVIPQVRQTSIGIGCADIVLSHGLKKELDMFMARYCPNVEKISEWGALIPNVKDVKTFQIPLAGGNWILIGDAAGHVNPISGEGILYALLDGELAAQAVAQNNLVLFDKLWKEMYGLNLFTAIKLRRWFYKKIVLEFLCNCLKLWSSIQPN